MSRLLGCALPAVTALAAGCGLTGNETADAVLEGAALAAYHYAVW